MIDYPYEDIYRCVLGKGYKIYNCSDYLLEYYDLNRYDRSIVWVK